MVPKGLKPVRRTLATGETRLYWYHRATGQRLEHDPQSAQGHLEVAKLDGRAEPVATPQRSLAALWDRYRASPEWTSLKPRTRSDYQAVRDWIGEAAKLAIVKDIEVAHVLSLRDKAHAAKGRRFANYVVQVLRMVLEWGRLRGWRKDNPAIGKLSLRKPTGSAVVNRAWSDAEVRAFMAAAPKRLVVPFALGLYAGMRQGDALIATWSAYDGATIRWIAGKNGESCMAPVTGTFKEILDDAKERRDKSLQIAVTMDGTPWTASGFRASFFKLLRALREAGHVQPGCTFHGLRHTIASGARDDNQSDSRVAAAIGDKTSAMAEIYGRDSDRSGAQMSILEATQKRFANNDWKTEGKTGRDSGSQIEGLKTPQTLMG
jgi:integrase